MPKKVIRREHYDERGRKVVTIMDKRGITVRYADSDEEEGGPDHSDEHWYKKPVGILVLSVTGGLILLVLGATLRHFFPALFGQ